MNYPQARRPKSYERATIEAVLMTATEQNPVSVKDVCAATGLELEVCRIHVHKCVTLSLAFNTKAVGVPGMYAWGQPSKPERVERVPVMRLPVYIPPKQHYARPGGRIAYSLPSLHEGERIERKRPVLIGGAQ